MSQSSSALALLASQHHNSEYNRIKFGAQGSPVHYVPLSFHLPDLFEELRQRQLQSAQAQSWWPCNKDSPSQDVIVLGPSADPLNEPDGNLQRELLTALTESISVPDVAADSQHLPLKTSSTHPINVSFLISPELAPLISSHLLLNSSSSLNPSPTVFEIPTSFTLDRLTVSHHHHASKGSLPLLPPTPPSEVCSPRAHPRTRSTIVEALQAALDSNMAESPLPTYESETNPPSPLLTPTLSLPTWHSNVSSLSLSLTTSATSEGPLSCLADLTPALDDTRSCGYFSGNASMSSSSFRELSGATANLEGCDEVVTQDEEQVSPSWASFSLLSPPESRSQRLANCATKPPSPPPFTLGNLFLSSCPGKKVRLDGPVKGRTGICRDLFTDLKRIKDLGVGCIICCLDDGELDFLGSPWPMYERTAQQIGIDVLRIPTPEGLGPLTPVSLDVHLTHLIARYTLRGVPVLVHCRGGVGRAGVVACCWLIKLGLCGWIDEDNASLETLNDFGPSDNDASYNTVTNHLHNGDESTPLNPGVVVLVKRVISVIRKRRSIKAIETYEQVKFLVDYVEFLWAGSRT